MAERHPLRNLQFVGAAGTLPHMDVDATPPPRDAVYSSCSMMAAEAIKQITRAGKILSNQMLIFDILHSDVNKININKNSECQVCKGTL